MLARVVAGGVECDLAMLAIDLIPTLKRTRVRRTMGFGRPLPRLARGMPL